MVEVKIINHENYEDFIKMLQFRYKVYVNELSYIKLTDEFEILKMEFDEFDKFSTFFILEEDKNIIGCSRIIEDKGIGLPVYKKTNVLENSLFSSSKNVELGRFIIDASKQNSKLFALLLSETFNYLFKMNKDFIFADTFKYGESYRILNKLGFKASNKDYFDQYFNPSDISTLLFCKKEELREEFNSNPNDSQKVLLKYYARVTNQKSIKF